MKPKVPNWTAICVTRIGERLGNRWKCHGCSRKCGVLLPLHDSPPDTCEFSQDDSV